VLQELQQRENAMKSSGEGEIVEAEIVEIVEES
jgi:hypothetical protein